MSGVARGIWRGLAARMGERLGWCALALLVVFAFIWLPVLRHYYVPEIPISEEQVEQSRRAPSDAIWAEIAGFNQGVPNFSGRDKDVLVEAAEKVLSGRFEAPGWEPRSIRIPFDPNDLTKGPGSWQLRYSSLVVPRLLVAAYEQSRREEFLTAARDFILDWARFEASLWLPRGLIWNDHAVAARAITLADFWRVYRDAAIYDAGDAKRLLEYVARTGRKLADDSFFTFATNHGVMQNLALLHLCVAFPAVPGTKAYQDRALERLARQMDFYVNPEGVVLEHSADYQMAGVQLLATTFRYMTLLGLTIPPEWRMKYAEAEGFYAELRRPDGSLPRLGDTLSFPSRAPMVTLVNEEGQAAPLYRKADWKPPRSYALYPAAGYAIWWHGLEHWPAPERLSQTVVAWSHYPGHAHKHADELSLTLWAGGTRWWTSAGYMPYSVPLRSQVVSWGGSNAPHLVGEPAKSERQSRLLGYGWSDGLAAIDLEREGPDGFRVRRQVIFIHPGSWMILDSFRDSKDRRARTIWTADPGLSYEKGPTGDSLRLVQTTGNRVMAVHFLGSPELAISTLQGSTSPIAGWVEQDGAVVPAPAFLIEQPSDSSWSLVVSQLEGPNSAIQAPQPRMLHWDDPEHWELTLPGVGGEARIRRDGMILSHASEPPGARLTLEEGPDVAPIIARTRDAFRDAKAFYGRKFHPSLDRRWKATYALIGLLIAQEIFFAIYRIHTKRSARALRVLTIPTWLVASVMLSVLYVS